MAESIAVWLQDRISSLDIAGVSARSDHPNYPAWRAALEELGRQHGVDAEFRMGASPHYARYLQAAGADIEQIKALHTLFFQ